MAFFEGLIETEDGAPVDGGDGGREDYYVIDDAGLQAPRRGRLRSTRSCWRSSSSRCRSTATRRRRR